MEPWQPHLHPLRAAVLLASSGSLTAVVSALAAAPVRRVIAAQTRPVTFPETLEAAAAVTAVACAGWLLVASVLVCGEALPARSRNARRATWLRPEWMRRVVAAGGGAALGVTLVTSPAASVPAAPGPGAAAAVAGPLVAGLPVPDRVTGLRATSDGGADALDRYTVAAGDSLWLIAEGLLPPDSSAAEVAAASRLLHRANRDRIGPDVDLIFPGTTLHVPAPLSSGKDRP